MPGNQLLKNCGHEKTLANAPRKSHLVKTTTTTTTTTMLDDKTMIEAGKSDASLAYMALFGIDARVFS